MNEVLPATLYIVSTPVGNLDDITLRALNVLKNVDIIACEDTRHSLKLLNHFQIKKHLIAYHSHNEKRSANGIIKLLSNQKSIALITDGGTPCISDPGSYVVKECIEKGYPVIPIPGASAFLTLLVASGFRTDHFYFHGFLSPKEGKQKKQLLEMVPIKTTHILYESPNRILKLIDNINEIFPTTTICIGKELTKINETILIGNGENLSKKLSQLKIIGEFVLLIANY